MSRSTPRSPLLKSLPKSKMPNFIVFNSQAALLHLFLTFHCHTCESADFATCTPQPLPQDIVTDVSTLAFEATSCYAFDLGDASQRLSIAFTVLSGSAELFVLDSAPGGTQVSGQQTLAPDENAVNVFRGGPGTFSAFLPQPGLLLTLKAIILPKSISSMSSLEQVEAG